ncbi:MAG: hypothetical protein ILA52_01420, partial [Alphaproteobacteria bacterium]|nr:hypothetical protein [Alphaproteobacteria bacterium]
MEKMMILSSPQHIIEARKPYINYGNRLNAMFMSYCMDDGEGVRKLVHNNHFAAKKVLRTFYEYYIDGNKRHLLEKIAELENVCGFFKVERIDDKLRLKDWCEFSVRTESN